MNPNLHRLTLLFIAPLVTILSGSAQSVPAQLEAPSHDIEMTNITIASREETALSWLRTKSGGPADPTNPSRPLFCNENVQKQFERGFMKTRNGEGRFGLAEAGRAIELKGGTILFGSWVVTDSSTGERGERANKMMIPTDGFTIAVFHTHGNSAKAIPSASDLKGDIPNFVVSRFAVYVTIPGTGSFLRLFAGACK
jgi:hypothetical protein